MDVASKERLFAKEYSRLFDRLYRYVRARLASPQDAEDVVADAMLAGFRALPTYDDAKGNLEQWLMGIAKYKLIAHWKQRLPALDLDALNGVVGDVGDMFSLDGKLAWSRLMESIPVEYHALFTMRFSFDMTYEEIAEVAGKSPAAMRQVFSRLLRKLRVEFAESALV